jgi:hypothetical protein
MISASPSGGRGYLGGGPLMGKLPRPTDAIWPNAAMSKAGRGIIDQHPDRAAIEREIAVGRPARIIGRKYGVHKDAVLRHRKKLPPQLKAALAGRSLRPATDLEKLRIEESDHLQNLGAQRARLLMMQDQAIENGQPAVVAMLSSQIHTNLALVGRYLGEFAQHQVRTNISILVQPEYLRLRSALVQTLVSFPDARRAVAEVLHRLEAQSIAPMIDVAAAG